MPNTYSQIHVHVVFTVARRQNLIHHEFKDNLYRYITGIIQKRGHKLLAINGMPDHVHLLIGFRPEAALSDLIRDVKSFSARHINESGWLCEHFKWQEGFGAFSYSRSDVPAVIRYIRRQEEHHREQTFQEEYLEILQRFEVEYDRRYLFDWIEEGGGDNNSVPGDSASASDNGTSGDSVPDDSAWDAGTRDDPAQQDGA